MRTSCESGSGGRRNIKAARATHAVAFVMIVAAVAAMLAGCGGATLLDGSRLSRLGDASWLVLVAMSADNDLESRAIEDVNEMEAAGIDGSGVVVLALLDRTPGYDDSNGDWTGTRLYRITDDPNGLDATIRSLPIASPSLGIDSDSADVELDLCDPAALRAFVKDAQAAFRPDHTALVIWGHGSGYRSAGGSASDVGSSDSISRSVASARVTAWDDTSGGSLSTAELADALRGLPIDVLGLDTCFGASLEIAYEVRDMAGLFVASEDEEPADGWEYDDLLARFALGDQTPRALATTIVASYASVRSAYADATISTIDLSRIDAVLDAHNEFSNALFLAAEDPVMRDAVRSLLFYDTEDFYTTPGDLAIDVADAADLLERELDVADPQSRALRDAVDAAVVEQWSGSGHPRANGLAVHLCPLAEDGTALPHDPSYVRGSESEFPLAFVRSSTWTPDIDGHTGLLYRLFYEDRSL